MKRMLAALLFMLAAVSGSASSFAQDDASTEASPKAIKLQQLLAMEIPEEKMALARKLIDLTGTARLFDELLPNIAEKAKNNFIRANPQMQLGIITVVDKVAIQMVNRRPELDDYLARIWASGFSSAELQELIDFYGTDVGKKYSIALPQLLAVQTAAAGEWSKSVAEELTQKVQAELRASVAAEQKALQSDVAGPAADAPQQ